MGLDSTADVYRPDVDPSTVTDLVISAEGGRVEFRVDADEIPGSPSNVSPGGAPGEAFAAGRTSGAERWTVKGPFSVKKRGGSGQMVVDVQPREPDTSGTPESPGPSPASGSGQTETRGSSVGTPGRSVAVDRMQSLPVVIIGALALLWIANQ